MKIAILVISSLLGSIAFGQTSSDNFPDSPQNHWVYESLADLQSEGILVGHPDTLGRGIRPSTRYEMVIAVNASYVRFHGMAEGWSRDQSLGGKKELSREEARWKAGKLRAGKKLITLIEYFGPELKNLGCVPDGMNADVRKDLLAIGERQPEANRVPLPFPDVKPSHWASGAVRNLWVEGILRGYPDEKFRG